MDRDRDGWCVERLRETRALTLRPVFSADSKNVYCAFGDTISIYLTKNAQYVGELSHPCRIAAFSICQQQGGKLVSCTVDGQLFVWDCDSQATVKYYQLPFSNVSSVFFRDAATLLVATRGNELLSSIFEFVWPDSNVDGGSKEVQTLSVFTLHNKKFVIPTDERKVAVEVLYGYCLVPRKNNVNRLELKPMQHECKLRFHGKFVLFESVASHAPTGTVAAAITTGQIFLWFDVIKYGIRCNAHQTIHWQKSPPRDLLFTEHGTSLFSGGGETVLVKYTLHSSGQATNQFLPRIGGPIRRLALSSDGTTIAVVLNDNGVHLVNSALMKSLAVIQRVSKSRVATSVGLQYDDGCLLTNGRPGQLQFVEPDTGALLYSIDITGQNVPDEDRLFYGEQQTWSEVIFAARSSSGDWLVTLECRSDSIVKQEKEAYLKWWRFDQQDCVFSLHTVVDSPHQSPVTSTTFLNERLLTSGRDGKVKLWNFYEIENVWRCDRVLTYRCEPCTALACSSRDVVLAGGFGGPTIALWATGKWNLLGSGPLCQTDNEDVEIRQLLWGVHSSEHMLIARTDGLIVGWDARSFCAVWTVAQHTPTLLAVDRISGLFACLGDQEHVILFSARHPKPLLCYAMGQRCSAMCFVPGEEQCNGSSSEIDNVSSLNKITSRLTLLSTNGEYLSLFPADQSERINRKGQRNESETKNSSIKTPYSEFLATDNDLRSIVEPMEVQTIQLDHQANLQLFSAPAHTLPLIDILAPAFIRSCLISKRPNEPM